MFPHAVLCPIPHISFSHTPRPRRQEEKPKNRVIFHSCLRLNTWLLVTDLQLWRDLGEPALSINVGQASPPFGFPFCSTFPLFCTVLQGRICLSYMNGSVSQDFMATSKSKEYLVLLHQYLIWKKICFSTVFFYFYKNFILF